MKSIKDILTLVSRLADELRKTSPVDIALVGGYAVIAHGVGRTTTDVDFLIYSEQVLENLTTFVESLKKAAPGNFEVQLVEGSRIVDDPFPYDIIFFRDKSGSYPRFDFIIPKYKWELEGIKKAEPLEDIPFPVLPKPYLIAMKLKAGGQKDNHDVVELYGFLTDEEKQKTNELATLIRRNRNLNRLLTPPELKMDEDEDKDLLLS